MKSKTLWKDIFRSFLKSKGRFLSLFLLMALGSFALIGLKVTGPNLERTADQFISKRRVMDLTVIASTGFSKDDRAELRTIPKARVELGHLLDANLISEEKSIRLFSRPQNLSLYDLSKGHYPQNKNEIVLSSWLSSKYKLGDHIKLESKKEGLLNSDTYKIVGFASSSEIWSKSNLGSSTTGDGNLALYGLLSPDSFKMTENIARLRFDNLRGLNSFSEAYESKLLKNQSHLENLLADNGFRRLDELKKEGQEKISSSRKKIIKAKEEIAANEKYLSYLPAQEKEAAEKKLESTKEEIKSKESQLDEAQKEIDHLSEPTYKIYNRATVPGGEGYQIYNTSTSSISMVGNIFPVVLYFVAALVTFTTMTRFVDEERTNSALYLALGYSKQAILAKFLSYGLLASLLGTSLGIWGGTYLLSSLIAKIIRTNLIIDWTHFYFYWNYAFLAYGIAFVSAVLPVYLIVRKELFQAPAQLLLPKAPTNGSKILLERINFLWKRLTFTQKVTIRNIMRYKQRMFMTIFGVAGSVALLFSGLGIQSSLSKVVDHQFSNLTPYDIFVITKEKPREKEIKELTSFLRSDQVASFEKVKFSNTNLKIKGQKNHYPVNIVATDKEDLKPYLYTKSVKSNTWLKIPEKGVLISEKLARLHRVKEGQNLLLRDDQNHQITVKVKGIIDMNVGHYILMSNSYYQEKFQGITSKTAYYLHLAKNNKDAIKERAKELLTYDGVEGLSQNALIVDSVNAIVASLKNVMALLVFLSLLLALVILYNLTTINIAERIRELSTVKVLGFHDHEVTLYIYRETIILSVIGIVFGLIAGKYLHLLIMTLIGADNMNFGTQVDAYVYLLPVMSIIILILALGLMVDRRLAKLDMLEALKSVE
ncbi:FtsX-like permease family protein [Streptococcus catagoni]|uniref:FtsX-like permease family protein n=1 Tax=Streptococcus catagoni TaxID=2654874 RepID=UPI00140D5A0D|nr:FtsX-like permease family protein [Streptococcus catagoni]